MPEHVVGGVHTALAFVCLATGLLVLRLDKGTLRHRRIGSAYAVSLTLLNVTALSIYRDSATFGPFHWLALVSLATLASGMVPVLFGRTRRHWLELHAYTLCWSYVGLVAAGVAQVTSRLPGPHALTLGLPILAVLGAGGLLVHVRLPGVIERLWSPSGRVPVSRPGPEARSHGSCRDRSLA